MMPSGIPTSISNAGSPERRAWAEASAGPPAGRPAKRGPEAIGGATAPLPVGAIGTPPAQRRRMRDFVSAAPGTLKDLTNMVQEEFAKVSGALQRDEDKAYEYVEQQSLDNLQVSLDRRFAHLDSTFRDIDEAFKKISEDKGMSEASNKIQELDKAHGDLNNKLMHFEKDLVTWTAASDGTTRALAELQAVTAQHQAQSDEMIKAVVESHITAIRRDLDALEARVVQSSFETGINAAAAAPVRAPPGHSGYSCAPCGQNPFGAGGGLGPSGSAPPGFPHGPPGVAQQVVYPNGLCHCDHVVNQGNALTGLAARITAGETTSANIGVEVRSLASRLQALEIAREKLLVNGAFNEPPSSGGHHGGHPGGLHGGHPGGLHGPVAGAVVKWSSKLFDDRTALSDLYAFDGEKGGDAWRTRVRGYFIGCCPEMADWLDWAEGAPGKLPSRSDDQSLSLEDTINRGTSMGEESGVVLSMHV